MTLNQFNAAASRIPTRAKASQLPAATLLALACFLLSAFAPMALTQSLIWAACKVDCTQLGWLALEYAPWVGFSVVALLVSLLGRKSYELFEASIEPDRAALAWRLHVGCALLCVVLMGLSPLYAPDLLPQVVVNTSLSASGMAPGPAAAPLPR